MSFWTLLDRGLSIPQGRTFGQKVALWIGRRLAMRNANVEIHKTARISPDAKINPREGKIVIGAHSRIGPGVILQGNVIIGKHCSVQAYSIIIGYGKPTDSSGLITIKDHVLIAPHVMMLSANHVFVDGGTLIREQGLNYQPIIIESDVWIAGRVNITAGVTIGSGSVVGAASVVTKSIPERSVAIGIPAKVTKTR